MRAMKPIGLFVASLSGTTAGQTTPQVQTMRFSGNVAYATQATEIVGLTVDGRYVYGRTIGFGNGAVDRGLPGTIAYDAFQGTDTDLDGLDLDPVCADLPPHSLGGPSSRYWFGLGFSWQCYAEDIIPASGTENGIVSSLVMPGSHAQCDGGLGTVSEPLFIIFESWEGIDNFADFDGSDGEFGNTPDGLGFPFSLTDSDGDTFVDEFLGGIVMDFNNVDTDSDTIPDEHLSDGGLGYTIYFATGLETLGVPLTSSADLWDGGKVGTDGRSDGGIRLLYTRGDGGDQSGPLFGGFYPASKAQSMFWGTTSMQGGGGACVVSIPGFGVGASDHIIWGEGEDICNDGLGSWSGGAPSGNEVCDERYDTSTDVADWGAVVPDFAPLGLSIRIEVNASVGQDCCDVNQDTFCTPADFTAWVMAFSMGLSTCDVNQDCFCTPADFSAWLVAHSASTGGSPIFCTF